MQNQLPARVCTAQPLIGFFLQFLSKFSVHLDAHVDRSPAIFCRRPTWFSWPLSPLFDPSPTWLPCPWPPPSSSGSLAWMVSLPPLLLEHFFQLLDPMIASYLLATSFPIVSFMFELDMYFVALRRSCFASLVRKGTHICASPKPAARRQKGSSTRFPSPSLFHFQATFGCT